MGTATSLDVMPRYDTNRNLVLPDDYRRWVLVGSSLGLSYSEVGQGGHQMFNTTLMEPSAYQITRDKRRSGYRSHTPSTSDPHITSAHARSAPLPADGYRSAWPVIATANPCVSDVVWMTSDRDVYSWQKRTGDEDSYSSASLAALTGRALMILRAGFALKMVGSFVNGLMPFRAFVAAFLMTTNFTKPGIKNAPVLLSSLCPSAASASITPLISFLLTFAADVSASFSISSDFDISLPTRYSLPAQVPVTANQLNRVRDLMLSRDHFLAALQAAEGTR